MSGKNFPAKMRLMFETGRRHHRARQEFERQAQVGEMPGRVKCGYCSGDAIYSKLHWRQHITCIMCGGQMICQRNPPDSVIKLTLFPITCGPPYREWDWDR